MTEEDKQSKIIFENGEIICSLPITAHTSKIRVKRKGESFATCQNGLKEDDLIEWQISYYKPNTNKELIEIGEMLEIAYKNKIISSEEISEIEKYVEQIKNTFFEKYKFLVEKTDDKFYNFEVLYRKFPFIHKTLNSGCSIEVEIKHKQRAVGFQSMLYIFIPLKNVISEDGSNLIDRKAKSKERVIWKPSKIEVIETIKAFTLASKSHLQDIKDILEKITKS